MEINIKTRMSFSFFSVQHIKNLVLSILAIMLFIVPAFSQEVQDEKNYFVLQGVDDTSIIFQTLEWSGGNHIKWYEVKLETLDETTNTWIPENNAIPILGEQVDALPENSPEFLGDGLYKIETNKFTISLRAKDSGEPKKYRYMVTSYNLLGHKSVSTDFIEFEIIKAYVPVVEDISTQLIYLDTIYDPSIRVSGFNFKKVTDFYITDNNEKIRPIEVTLDDNERRAELVFNPNMYNVGEWFLTAENPGGFTSSQPLTIKFMKWYDIPLTVGYSPLVIFYDENIKKYFPSNFMPLGFDVRGSFFFLKRRAGFFGFSLNAKWNSITDETSTHGITTHLFQGFASFVYRYPFIRNRLHMEARIGGGITYAHGLLFQFGQSLTSSPFNSIFPAVTAGISVAGNIWRGLSIEAGADFMFSFTPEMFIMSVAPIISFGWVL